MFTPGSDNKFLFATLGGRLLEVGDYSNRGYYSNKYGICKYYLVNKPNIQLYSVATLDSIQ